MSDILRHPSVVPVHRGRLAAMELVPGSILRAREFVAAEVEIAWFRTVAYRVVLTHHGVEVVERAAFCDGSALFSGMDDAIAHGRSVMHELRVTSASSLRVEVRMTVMDVPNVPLPRPSYSTFDHYAHVPHQLYFRDLERACRWLSRTDGEKARDEQASPLRSIGSLVLVNDQLVWSTHAPATLTGEVTALRHELSARPFHLVLPDEAAAAEVASEFAA